MSPHSNSPHTEFRRRGVEVSRLEAFSDCVMAFALTLLVISLEVPKDPAEMLLKMRDALPFAVCFGIFMQIWFRHWAFFRRYGLTTPTVMALNTLLLFVLLLYVYPLRYVFWAWLGAQDDPSHAAATRAMTPDQVRQIFVIFGVGYAAVFVIFALLHMHALRMSAQLELTPPERCDTRNRILGDVATAALAGGSIAIALYAPTRWVGFAGWSYALVGMIEFAQGAATGAVWDRVRRAQQT
ncbi:MAG: TMEM175 family protein [Phycisphaerae bacterium]